MTNAEKILIALAVILAGFLGFSLRSSAPATLGAGLYQVGFSSAKTDATSSVGSSGALVASALGSASSSFASGVYLSLQVTSGTAAAYCFPSATTTGLTAPGGWALLPSSSPLVFSGIAVWNGYVSCITSSGTDTVSVIAQ